MDDDQRALLQLIMEGNTLGDIAEDTQTSYDSLKLRFRNAVYRLVRQNNLDWSKVYANGSQDGATKN